MSGPYQFGAFSGIKVPAKTEAKIDAIAAEHGCRFLCVKMPEGYQAWLETDSTLRSQTRHEVLTALREAGIRYWGQP